MTPGTGDVLSGSLAQDASEVLSLRLYVAGEGPNSCEARTNLAAILEGRPAEGYRLEVVDFLREPQRALKDGVIVTPTLVKLTPLPTRRIIGTLKETRTVLAATGMTEHRNV